MKSTLKPKSTLTIFSIVQLVLGIIGIIVLYSTPLGAYEVRVLRNTSTAGQYNYSYIDYSFFVGESSYTSAVAAGIAIMYLIFTGFSLFRVLSPNILRSFPLNQKLTQFAKFTPLLGVGIIGLGLVALNGFGQALSGIDYTYSWPDIGIVLVFVGGIIVVVTGLVANRLSRPASPTVYGYAGYVPPPSPSYPPPQVPLQAGYPCPTCGAPLTYVQQYNRWYCYNCKKYA